MATEDYTDGSTPGFEVHLRIRIVLFLTGLFAGTLSAGFAQTPSTPEPPASNAPAPTPAPATQQPARPAYDPDAQKKQRPEVQQPPAALMAPQQAPPPTPADSSATPANLYAGYPSYQPVDETPKTDSLGSTYIPMDSWVYPAMLRLYSMGYLDTAFIGMRPWTRRSAVHILQRSQQDIINGNNEEAQEILAKLLDEFAEQAPMGNANRGAVYGLHSAYTQS